jgi:PTS system nitrogen regulatory IIA component
MIIRDVQANSRKHVLELLSALLAEGSSGLTASEIYTMLNQRERLGSTCLGNGVALPHCRYPDLQEPLAAMLLLAGPVEFDGGDERGVSVVVGLLLPDSETHGELQPLARALRQPDTLAMLARTRSSADAAAIVNSRIDTAARSIAAE